MNTSLLKLLRFNVKNTPFRDFMRGFSIGWEWCKFYWSQPLCKKMVFPKTKQIMDTYQNYKDFTLNRFGK